MIWEPAGRGLKVLEKKANLFQHRNIEVWSKRENEEIKKYCPSTATIVENLLEFYKWNNNDT